MNTLTRRYTDEAITFIKSHRKEPFFVYLPHTMPHTRLGVSKAFRGTSRRWYNGSVKPEEQAREEIDRLLAKCG